MLQRVLLLLFFVLIIYIPYGQKQAATKSWVDIYQKAEALYTTSIPTGKTDSLALTLYKQTIELLAAAHEADTLFFRPYLYAGSIYYNFNNLDSAAWCYKKAEDILTKFPTVSESERLYNKLGALYYETGDYRKSIPYFIKALSNIENKRPKDTYFIVNYRNNIASALRKLGYTDSAITIYKQLLPLHINEDKLLHNIGVSLLDEGKNEEALFYLQKASYESATLYNNLAKACLRLHKLDGAENYINKALNVYQKTGKSSHDFDYANTLLVAGDLFRARGEGMNAIRKYQESIINLKADFTDTSIYSNPGSFHNLINSFVLFDALVAKAEAFTMLKEEGTLHAFNAYNAALILAKQLELRYHSDEARLFLSNKVTPACREAVDLGISLFKKTGDHSFTDKIFRWSEGNKASVLQAGLYSLQMDSISSLPASLLMDSKSSKALLAKLNLEESMVSDSITHDAIMRQITDLEIRLAGLQEKLEEYPAYKQLVFASRETGLDSLRKNIIAGDEAIVSFYYTTKHLIFFYITKEESGVTHTALQNNLGDKINQYRQELNAGEGADNLAITNLSTYLFNQLIQPVYEKIKDKKHLVIIPYNEISYVPFESLINPVKKEFLLKDFAVSYEYSANFLKEKLTSFVNPYQVLALAPFAGTRQVVKDLPILPASRAEIESLKGSLLFDQQASKKNFISLLPGFPVIHLATHAKANDIEPLQSYIEFYNNNSHEQDTSHRLYEQEIYQLDMKSTRLVILSACETGSGQLINGEGVMSLSRAFSYAGCPAVITSLWKAEDRATSFISQHLHMYLAQGKAIDEALQEAKRDYLQSSDIPSRYKSPVFWAHLVLIGDYQPVHRSDHFWIWFLSVSLFLFFAAVFFYYKKNGRKQSRPLVS